MVLTKCSSSPKNPRMERWRVVPGKDGGRAATFVLVDDSKLPEEDVAVECPVIVSDAGATRGKVELYWLAVTLWIQRGLILLIALLFFTLPKSEYLRIAPCSQYSQ
jgi:hypothetical protein